MAHTVLGRVLIITAAVGLAGMVGCAGDANTVAVGAPVGVVDPPGTSSNLAGDIVEPADVLIEPTATPVPAGVALGEDDPGVLPWSVAGEDSRLKIKLQGLDGPRVPIKNGGAVRLGDGLTAEIFVDPYPTDTLTAWLDLYVSSDDGEPVSDASVVIDYDMYSMAHGPFFSLADEGSQGHYVFRLDYIMFGPWMQLLEIKMPDTEQAYRLEVVIVAVP